MSEKSIYCSFILNQSEFALSVSYVQEVINPPESYSTMPLAPNYLKGLINLRGVIIPVVDLKKVLNMKEESTSAEQKIAIIYLKGNFVGLLFDKTEEVFSAVPEEQSNFAHTEEGSVVKGVFKKDHGKRIIQILDVESIFCLKNIPKREDGESLNKSLKNSRGKRRQAISFIVGHSKCAVEIKEIQEILKIDGVNDSALAVGCCIGTFDLRGITVPVIDFASLLKYRETDTSAEATSGERRVIVMKVEKELFGLLVDKVDSIITFYDDDLKFFPVLVAERVSMIKGCISIKDKEDVLLLDESKILTDSEILHITRGHSNLYSINQDAGRNKVSKSSKRLTFITFSIEQEYGINISDIREIIDLPTTLMKPPGMPAHYRGIVNLRGEMVMIVDSRTMYQKNKNENESKSKVLIFKIEGAHFGLVVDSVQAIITFGENDKIKLPEMMYSEKAGQHPVDILEAVQYTSHDQASQVMLILDAKLIAKRILDRTA